MEGDKGSRRLGRVVVEMGDVREEYVMEEKPGEKITSQVVLVAANRAEEGQDQSIRVAVAASSGFLKLAIFQLFENEPDVAREVVAKYLAKHLGKMVAGSIEKTKFSPQSLEDEMDKLTKGRSH